MAKELSIEEAVARAQRVQDDRITAIRSLAETRQRLSDVRDEAAERIAQVQRETAAQVAEAEKLDVLEYERAITAGWTPAELRKIGFSEPEKKARVRKRAAASTKARPAPEAEPATDSGAHLAVVEGEQLSA